MEFIMKLKHLACFAALTTPLIANADFLSVTAGAGIWDESPSGNFQKITDPVAVDVENNLFWDNETQGYVFVTIEHFVPIIPNFRLIHTKLDHDGSGTTTFDFDGDTFTGDVSNNISIETTDLIAYYEVLDNVVSLDLGLVIRNLKINYTITSAGSTTSDSIDETIPMLYALIGASPWPDLIISGELSYIAFEGSSISDFTAKVAYTTNFFVGFEAGYRKQTFELDDVSDTDADLSFDGVFAGAYIKF
ncbi:MAG: hypothetical protein COB77_03935 [Gammaproteobacteria bacterium]|nr:MAG: hypothetical protein COB77_03935 [Gammaproteobacteria bacterium]